MLQQGPKQERCVAEAPTESLVQGRYLVRWARSERDLDDALRLRFRVFNEELGEGLESSRTSGRDADRFDAVCHHLLVEDRVAGSVVGTYRMQTEQMARAGRGFYSDGEFHLEDLPDGVRAAAVEVGRACIAREHRSRAVLFLLWRGLAGYLVATGSRYFFGCCSLTGTDPALGRRAAIELERAGLVHPSLIVRVREGLECAAVDPAPGPFELPALFRTYLRYGSLVVSPPAIDREFGTVDFLVFFDVLALDPRSRRMFFGGAG